jgi:lanosterol synthase
VRALERHQWAQGEWEGEGVWCPMLAAQYALTAHITGQPLSEQRRKRLIQQFRATQLEHGVWGLHKHSEPYLFVTALVYVATRTLGMSADDPMLAPARRFFEQEGGVAHIPSWGKFWLALMNLYQWEGVNAVLPEAWLLPKSSPLHPSQYYCHTRMIYMSLSALYGAKYQAPRSPLIDRLREELFPQGFGAVHWAAARNELRDEELYAAPSVPLRFLYAVSQAVEQLHSKTRRAKILADMRERIRWELRTTDHTCLSPVNGMPGLIALWLADPKDPDFVRGFERLEGWIWEDDEEGTRVAGARSASWDTGFVLQTLARARPHVPAPEAAKRGAQFLESQQIRESFEGYRKNYRANPKGGWCFAGVWHGWPVSDCTAEALIGLLQTREHDVDPQVVQDGVRFMLQTQNRDGGFGSYERKRPIIGLEWMNPAEMFGDSMTEQSYIECTASCIEALALAREHHPSVGGRRVERAIQRGVRFLRSQQRADGSWPGAWGVQFIYGTLFAVRGLLAAGVPKDDPAIRAACQWMLARQRPEGGWGEHHQSTFDRQYVDRGHSHVVQTAWAMLMLLTAGDPDTDALERGAKYLASMQNEQGEWPEQEMVGIFFHTALMQYRHYKRIFPVWALGMYESRRQAELDRDAPSKSHQQPAPERVQVAGRV